MLYPIESETREVKDLAGLWDFQLDADDRGQREEWQLAETLPGPTFTMPVPASYNDITTDPQVRDHIGPVWYRRDFFVPRAWRDRRVAVRVGAASHRAIAWVNGRQICAHQGGFLPFEGEAGQTLVFGGKNTLTIRVDNILDWTTLPPGEVVGETGRPPYPSGYRHQEYFHDFFNYSGLHRPVRLVVRPREGIDDITVRTERVSGRAVVRVGVKAGTPAARISLRDASGATVASATGIEVALTVDHPVWWQPGQPYLYELQTEALDASGLVCDIYRLPVGLRTVRVESDRFLLNEQPFYFKGFGKHEDSDIRGKGLDDATNQRDFNLLKWIHANSFRTSHYPYAEEILRMADREGIVVIDEAPAVGLYFFEDEERPTKPVFAPGRAGAELRRHHADCVREMIARDKNHACVVMWSLGNETATHEDECCDHYRQIAALTRELDPTRPLTIVEFNFPWLSRIGDLVDVLSFNRYVGWYFDPSRLDAIELKLGAEIEAWHAKWKKPVFVTEYGAETLSGFHSLPSTMFSEEFQVELLDACHGVFDKYPYVVGEHVWAFADFATKQGITRVGGNKKGVFTRQRQPKAAAYYLKRRWANLAPKTAVDGAPSPSPTPPAK